LIHGWSQHPVTPDGRYFVVGGRHGAWPIRISIRNGSSSSMRARRAVKEAKSSGDLAVEAFAHKAVDVAKRALGERGPVWWRDGSPDLNRRMAKNSSYSSWHAALLRGRRGLKRA
jgi:hypothetical protein